MKAYYLVAVKTGVPSLAMTAIIFDGGGGRNNQLFILVWLLSVKFRQLSNTNGSSVDCISDKKQTYPSSASIALVY